MGKTIVKSHIAEAQYLSTTQYNTERMEQRLISSEQLIIKYSADIVKKQIELTPLEVERQALIEALNTAIDAANLLASGNKEYTQSQLNVFSSIQNDILKVDKLIAPLTIQLASLRYNLMSTRKDRDRLQTASGKYVDNLPIEIWCCDYTVDAEDEQNTIEINDETNDPNNQLIIIEPQSLSDESKKKSQVRKQEVLDAEEIKLTILTDAEDVISEKIKIEQARLDNFIGGIPDSELVKISQLRSELKLANSKSNIQHKFIGKITTEGVSINTPSISNGSWGIAHYLALQAAYQLHKPRYRQGVIQSVDKTLNTCVVRLDFTEVSSRTTEHNRKFLINQDEFLRDVPIEYMSCDAFVFNDGDRVIIKFYWSWDNPVVIGFVDNPIACPFPIYLEAAFLKLRSVALCNRKTFLPATIISDSGVLLEPNAGLAYHIGDRYFSSEKDDYTNDLSVSVGCEDNFTLVIDSCGNSHGTSSVINNVVVSSDVQVGAISINITTGLKSSISIRQGELVVIGGAGYVLASGVFLNEKSTTSLLLTEPTDSLIAEGAIVTTFNDAEPAYCDPAVIWMKKITQNRIPSSMFSGKMKLFVQAVYGSLRTDYSISSSYGTLPVSGDYDLFINNQKMNHLYPETVGIFTTDDYEYYIMRIGTDRIKFNKLQLSVGGEDWRLNLIQHPNKTDPEFLKRIESFILSTAKVDFNVNTIEVTFDGDQLIGGTPLAYGWKFNEKGNECNVVLHEVDVTNVNAIAYSITILQGEGTFTAILTAGKSGTWSRNQYFNVLVPDWNDYTQFNYGVLKTTNIFSTTDCPIYGFYKSDIYTEFVLNADVTTHLGNTLGGRDYDSQPCGFLEDAGSEIIHGAGTSGNIKLNESTATVAKVVSKSDLKFFHLVEARTLGGQGFSELLCSGGSVNQYMSGNGYIDIDGKVVDLGDNKGVYARVFTAGRALEGSTDIGGVTTTGRVTAVIPLLDCSAISIISFTTEASAIHQNLKRFDNEIEWVTFATMDVDAAGGSFTVPPGGEPTKGTTDLKRGTNGLSTNTSTIFIETFAPYSSSSAKFEHHDSNSQTIVKQNIGDTSWVLSYDQTDKGIGGLGGDTIISKSSWGGETIIIHGEDDVESPRILGYDGDSAVGWV